MAEYLEQNIEYVKECVQKNHTYRQISANFKREFPEVNRGFSERNIRLFCSKNGIKKLDNFQVDTIVQQSISEVGASYGRKMMAGYINSKGHSLSRRQVRASLQRVNPVDHNRRRDDIVRRQNPVPYNAPYYGNKLHCDQNEKLAMYGCTLYAFSDGCSSKIIKMCCMPRKNTTVIYSHFREILVNEGIWDMVRVDHGTEACLMLFIQDYLKNHRGNVTSPPYVQTRSRENLPAERKWPEVNQRVLYPIKEILVGMENRLLINRDDPILQFCVSFITMNVVNVGIERVVAAWNAHPIEGVNSKIPNVVAQRTSRVSVLDPAVVPSVNEAVEMYIQAGGSITPESSFGVDHLANDETLIRRRELHFSQNIGSFTDIFNNIISGDKTLMETAILLFFNTTVNLSTNI